MYEFKSWLSMISSSQGDIEDISQNSNHSLIKDAKPC